jgi:GntR family transcriptional repressor for pyruvate dehydrogenase complex
VPDILSNYSIFKVCDTVSSKAVEEHRQLFLKIRDRDALQAAAIMQEHLKGVMDFAKALVQ